MYLKQTGLSIIVALVLILAIGTTVIIKGKPVLAQSESSAITTSQLPSSGEEFSAKMTGREEVPRVSTDTTGTIKLADNSQQRHTLDYDLTLTNLNGVVTGAHIHMGKPGINGPIVADLNIPSTSAAAASSSSAGGNAMTSSSVSGTITSGDLKGPLAGKQISDLVKLIKEGRAYANIDTKQNQKGEIRGQLTTSSLGSSASHTTSTVGSASASATAP